MRTHSTARVDRGVIPETYSLKTYRSSRSRFARSRRSAIGGCGRSATLAPRPRTEIEPDEYALDVRQVADDLLDWYRKATHQGRHRQNLIAPPKLRVLDQIDDLDAVAASQVLVADLPQVRERADRLRGLSGDIEPEVEDF